MFLIRLAEQQRIVREFFAAHFLEHLQQVGHIHAAALFAAHVQHHVALVKYGSSLKVYLNGSSAISQTVSGALYDNGAPLIIGGDTNVNFWIGHIDEVIYETGARWTANFTPPDAPFPDS